MRCLARPRGFDDALMEKHRQMIIGEMEAQTRERKWGVKDPSAVSALALAARGGHIDVVFVLLAPLSVSFSLRLRHADLPHSAKRRGLCVYCNRPLGVTF